MIYAKFKNSHAIRCAKTLRYGYLIVLVTCIFFSHTGQPLAAPNESPEIKLILQITVDGLRGDLLHRYENGFQEGGFRYLMTQGVYFANAHYQHANTETIVGHTTLATGTTPAEHGMVGNVWFDSQAGELAYNIEDPNAPILPSRKEEISGTQVDPSQKQSRTKGRSPKALLSPTFTDMLMAYYAGQSKIFAVSGKDRSAVAMAGKTGKAFWYSTDTGDFVTSTYYYDAYPDWVKAWNAERKAESLAGSSWSLLYDSSVYLLQDQDDREYEVDLKGFSRVFPHPFGEKDDKLLYTKVLVSPQGNHLALDFSKQLIKNEQLGQDSHPDYLSISFSSVDAVNHFFGPSSLENEDIVYQLDKNIADLLSYIDQNIGLKHTLIVLSADHGMADMPEYLTELGYEAGRLETDDIVRSANEVGEEFDIDEVVLFFYRPYLYLNKDKIAATPHDAVDIEQAIADALTDLPGIALAKAKSRLLTPNATPLVKRIRNNHHKQRSGDIYIAQDPYWFLFEKGPVKAMHGSPWRYDTHVPIIFTGPAIERKKISREVHPMDVAPTMAAYLGMTPPGSSQGKVLEEVLP